MEPIKHRDPLEFLGDTLETSIRVTDPFTNESNNLVINAPEGYNFPPYLLILPTALDLHVHFREPGFTHKEDFTTGSIAALAGGVNFVVDMPNTKPPTTTPERLAEKEKLRNKKSYIPVLLAGGITHDNYDDIDALARKTPVLKTFIATSFGELSINREQFLHAIKKLDKMGYDGMIYLHCEDPEYFHPEFDTDPKNYWKVRPEESEIQCFKKHLKIAKQFPRLRFQFTHTTLPTSAQMVLNARKEGLNVNLDVTITHLAYDKDTPCLQPWKLKMNPPLRTAQSVKKLKQMMFTGLIPYTASDHAPHTVEEKLSENIPPGNPGVQETYPYFIDKVLKKKMSWKTLLQITHNEPKKQLQKYVSNHSFVVVDPNQNTYVDYDWIKTKVKWSLWEEWVFKGKILGIIFEKENRRYFLPINNLPNPS